MSTVVVGGKKRHQCDEQCQRICDRCTRPWIVHGMYRWGLQTFLEPPSGGGGLVCDGCATAILEMLHGGALSKHRADNNYSVNLDGE